MMERFGNNRTILIGSAIGLMALALLLAAWRQDMTYFTVPAIPVAGWVSYLRGNEQCHALARLQFP